jgi:hypothetical protein
MAINVSVEEGANDPVNVQVALAYPSHTHTVTDITNVAEDIQDLVGAMVSSNTEEGIAVTYDDATGKINFNVGDFTLTLDGDVSGSGTVTNLGNATITTTVADNSHNHVSTNITDFEEAVQDAAQAMITAATHAGLSVSYNDLLNTLTFNVNDPVITIAGDATGSATMTNLGDTTITVDLSNTGVTAGTYGDADSVGQFQVDEDGRIVDASNVNINILSTQVSDFTEAAQDAAAPLLNHSGHTNVTVSYDDNNNKLILTGSGNVLSVNGETGSVTLTTDDIDEGLTPTNLWFTTDRAQDAAGSLLAGASTTGIDINYNPTTNGIEVNNTGILSIDGTVNEIDAITTSGNTVLSFPNEVIFPQNVTVTGNLTVEGSETIVNTTNLNVSDETILLNAGFTGLPAAGLTSGIEVERGSLDNALLVWREGLFNFAVSTDGGLTFQELSTVYSVNGLDGTVVLSTDEVDEGSTNFYYSDARVDTKLSSFLNVGNPDPSINFEYVPEDTLTETPSQFFAEVLASPKTQIQVKNESLVDTIALGAPVYISGYDTDTPIVSISDNSIPSSLPAIGLAQEFILPETLSYVVTSGQMLIDTGSISGATVGASVYVGNGGSLTVDPDTIDYPQVTQRIGIITRLSSAPETADGIIYVLGGEGIIDAPRLQEDYFYLGNSTNAAATPTYFAIENIRVQPYTLISDLEDPTTVDNGSYRYVLEDANVYVNQTGIWKALAYDGHLHEAADISDFSEALTDSLNTYFTSNIALSGLEFSFDDVTDTGTLSVRDPEVTFTITGDVEGTVTQTWENLSDIEFDVTVLFDTANFANYSYDLFDHTRHSNITAEVDLNPLDASGPQIILHAPTPYTQEEIQDFVSPLLDHSNHTNVTVTYDDGPSQLLLSVPDSVDLIQFGTRPAVNGNVLIGFNDIVSALGYTPLNQTDGEKATDLIAPSIVHDNHVNVVTIYDDDNDRIVMEVQTAGAASVGSLTNSWWLGT